MYELIVGKPPTPRNMIIPYKCQRKEIICFPFLFYENSFPFVEFVSDLIFEDVSVKNIQKHEFWNIND